MAGRKGLGRGLPWKQRRRDKVDSERTPGDPGGMAIVTQALGRIRHQDMGPTWHCCMALWGASRARASPPELLQPRPGGFPAAGPLDVKPRPSASEHGCPHTAQHRTCTQQQHATRSTSSGMRMRRGREGDAPCSLSSCLSPSLSLALSNSWSRVPQPMPSQGSAQEQAAYCDRSRSRTGD